jgi:hypothetical protein
MPTGTAYNEYDVLFASDAFKEDLEKAAVDGVWCFGNDMRNDEYDLSLVERVSGLGTEGNPRYLLGCCVFYSREFMNRLGSSIFSRGFYSSRTGWTTACPLIGAR